MSLQETKTPEKTKSKELGKIIPVTKSIGWLVETVMRFLVSYIILTNFSNIFAIAAGVYFVATGAVLLVAHFVKAYTK